MRYSKPTIYDPNFLPNTIYSGVPSWLNLPVLECRSDLKGLDAAVIGIPWEGGCTIGGYSSCTEGPKSIRSVSIRYTGFLPDFGIDCTDYLKIGDYGDVACRNGDYGFTFEKVRERIGEIIDEGLFPITFGGDHGIAVKLQNGIPTRSVFCTLMRIWTTMHVLGTMNYPAVLRFTVCTMTQTLILRKSSI